MRPAPWNSPWQFLSFWVAIVLVLIVWLSGLLFAFESRWRAQSIAVGRAIQPVLPDPNDPDLPICLVFASYRENYPERTMQPLGRLAGYPEEEARRMALLLAALAALPQDARPRIIGIDVVFPVTQPDIDPYLAAALRRNSPSVLVASEETSGEGIPRLLTSNDQVTAAADAVALSTYHLPLWLNPGGNARLYSPGRSSYHWRGDPVRGFALEIANRLDDGSAAKYDEYRRLPLYYRNLYYPGQSGDGSLGANWLGLWPADAAFRYIRVVDPWTDGEDPEAWLDRVAGELSADPGTGALPPAEDFASRLAGRIVLIGVGHPHDLAPTPFTSALYRAPHVQGNRLPRTPGVALHAEMITTLLKDQVPWEFALRLPVPYVILSILLMAGAWILALRKAAPISLAVLSISAILVFVFDGAFVTFGNLWLNPMGLVLPAGFVGAAGIFEQYRLLARSRQKVRQWVNRLMPSTSAAVIGEGEVDLLASAGDAISAKPESAWRTVLRTDMAGYTPLTRGLELAGRPDLMMSVVSDFFLRAIDLADQHGGQITDLTGDGLVATFTHDDPAEQSRAAALAAVDIAAEVDNWRRRTEAVCHEAGLETVPVPGVRIAVGASETNFRWVGNERQQRALFFGGAFVIAARIEAGIKDLPLPEGNDPLRRTCFDEDSARHLGDNLPSGLSLHRHQGIRMKGYEKPVDVFEILWNKGNGSLV